MQGSIGEMGPSFAETASTTASLSRPATHAFAADFTLAQRVARYGLTVLAIVAMSALFASQIAATMR